MKSRILAVVTVMAAMFITVPAFGHVVDGQYRDDVSSCSEVPNQECSSGNYVSAGTNEAEEQSQEQSSTSGSSGSGGYSIPESIVECESGGDYSAVNPSSGAGYLQISCGAMAGSRRYSTGRMPPLVIPWPTSRAADSS